MAESAADIVESLSQLTQWVVFETNAEPAWSKAVRQIADVLADLWREGKLFGKTASEAFFVKCDRTTMTQDDIAAGRVIIYVGLALKRPAEFDIFRIGHATAS